jgi:hypothetical protein
MPEIPGFWAVGPHVPLPVEETWTEFVSSLGGSSVADLIPASPGFNNADFIFPKDEVILELKEIETEFLTSESARRKLQNLILRLMESDPSWKPGLLGGNERYPEWFWKGFLNLAKPGITRILKKANRQIRETKDHFGIHKPTGVIVFVNDGFTSLIPSLVMKIACDSLINFYSSIDCFLYVTVNRYIVVVGSNEPKLIWVPFYSDRASSDLPNFVNNLGREWHAFLESKIGPFTSRTETDDGSFIRHTRALTLPGERRS